MGTARRAGQAERGRGVRREGGGERRERLSPRGGYAPGRVQRGYDAAGVRRVLPRVPWTLPEANPRGHHLTYKREAPIQQVTRDSPQRPQAWQVSHGSGAPP